MQTMYRFLLFLRVGPGQGLRCQKIFHNVIIFRQCQLQNLVSYFSASRILSGVKEKYRKSLSFLNFKSQFFSSSPPPPFLCILFEFTRARDFTNQLITSKNSNLDIGKLTWTFFADFQLFFFSVFVHVSRLPHCLEI